jgi:branched-subunit amino acid aminotransferase/4-amino-4-deoxychorismate lyase
MVRVEVNGRPATAEDLQHPTLVNYGHLTAMQVRDGRTRGLDLHLSRLSSASQALFDDDLDLDTVRSYIRHALADTAAASVRVSVYADQTVVAVRPPNEWSGPQSLLSVAYQRPVPHIKHVGSFGQIYYGRLAAARGYDDALLTGPYGDVSEASISNIAFFDGSAVVWPSAPCLDGITQQLLRPRLPVASRHSTVLLDDLPSFTAAYVMNSSGVAAVARIDETELPGDAAVMKTLTEVYDSVPWDVI